MQSINEQNINKTGYHPTVETRGYSRPEFHSKSRLSSRMGGFLTQKQQKQKKCQMIAMSFRLSRMRICAPGDGIASASARSYILTMILAPAPACILTLLS